MSDLGWIDAMLTAARPQAVAALLRHFRDLDAAEEAVQEACLRALKTWPEKGPPRDPAAWLIFVGKNAAIDTARRQRRQRPLDDDTAVSDLEDREVAVVEAIDDGHYRDDILRLLFICCHPDLVANQQIALALRVVSGLSVSEIAAAFLTSESAMEQRITRAKRRIAASAVEYGPPGPGERAERLPSVGAMIYLIFNEGYAASGGEVHVRVHLCDEAIRLTRLVIKLFPSEPEMLGLAALMLLQHARTPARLAEDGSIVLLEDQDRRRWDAAMIGEGLAMLDKAMRHAQPGPYQVQAAIAALHARAAAAAQTDWRGIELLYATLERMSPSPVVTLNRAVAVSKVKGAAAALDMVEPLENALKNYFYFHGLRGALLSRLGRVREARSAFDMAISRARSAEEAAHIRMQLDRLEREANEATGR